MPQQVEGRRLDQGEAAHAVGSEQSHLERDGGAEGVPDQVDGLAGAGDHPVEGVGHRREAAGGGAEGGRAAITGKVRRQHLKAALQVSHEAAPLAAAACRAVQRHDRRAGALDRTMEFGAGVF